LLKKLANDNKRVVYRQANTCKEKNPPDAFLQSKSRWRNVANSMNSINRREFIAVGFEPFPKRHPKLANSFRINFCLENKTLSRLSKH
jgi:hypothetical protein